MSHLTDSIEVLVKNADDNPSPRHVEIDAIAMRANLGVPIEHDVLSADEYLPLAHCIGIGFGVATLATGIHSVRPEYGGDVARVWNASKNSRSMVV